MCIHIFTQLQNHWNCAKSQNRGSVILWFCACLLQFGRNLRVCRNWTEIPGYETLLQSDIDSYGRTITCRPQRRNTICWTSLFCLTTPTPTREVQMDPPGGSPPGEIHVYLACWCELLKQSNEIDHHIKQNIDHHIGQKIDPLGINITLWYNLRTEMCQIDATYESSVKLVQPHTKHKHRFN